MRDVTLRERAEAAFTRAHDATSACPGLAELDAALTQAKAQLDRPMTVAVVGRIKAGKSTMTNALLGQRLAATGPIECTYNVNWFHFGETPSLIVHYRDGRPPERHEPEELERLTRRAAQSPEALAGIDYIDVRARSPLLRRFSLVDTPGLDSAYVADSKNTAAFLGLHSAQISERTAAEARNADAVLYLFSRALAASGAAVVEEFQGPAFGRATPLNAIGVLTKVDANWRSADDPLEHGRKSAADWMREPESRRLFFAIRPVCALVALGAETLTEEEYEALRALSVLSGEALRSALGSARRFAAPKLAGVKVDAALRGALFERLGAYGIVLATDLLRKRKLKREALARELYRASGMADLEDLVVSHFGNRALLIKLERLVGELRALCLRERGRRRGAELRAVLAVDDALDGLSVREHAFAELAVLRRHYEGALDLDGGEIEELLRVTGESGTSIEERLGAEAGTPPDDLVAIAARRVAHWSLRAQLGSTKATLDAATTLRRSYERLAALAKSPAEAAAVAGSV
jgi:hypothetical protein